LAFHSAECGRAISLSDEAERALTSYPWPGNVRELENAVERAVVLSGADVLTPEAFALEPLSPEVAAPHETMPIQPAVADGSLQAYLDHAAGMKIRSALTAAKGNRAETAAALGVDRTTLYRLMKRLGLEA
jgi:DNA-binding NtrC family response regulator